MGPCLRDIVCKTQNFWELTYLAACLVSFKYILKFFMLSNVLSFPFRVYNGFLLIRSPGQCETVSKLWTLGSHWPVHGTSCSHENYVVEKYFDTGRWTDFIMCKSPVTKYTVCSNFDYKHHSNFVWFLIWVLDQLYNLWGWVQNENVGPLVQNLLILSWRWRQRAKSSTEPF